MNDEILDVPDRSAQRSGAGYPPPPEFGDVIDALDDAAAAFRVVVRNRSHGMVDRIRARVRERPLTSVAAVAGIAWLYGRLRR